jgi:hypothetical protein
MFQKEGYQSISSIEAKPAFPCHPICYLFPSH